MNQNKPIDKTFIDFLMKATPADTMFYNSTLYKEFRQMSVVEVAELFWFNKETLEDLAPLDPAHGKFYQDTERLRRYAALHYLHQPEVYKETNLAIYYSLLTRNVGNTPSFLKELLDTYNEGVFTYLLTKQELVLFPYPNQRGSSKLLEFMEAMKQFRVSDGASATDALVWKRF